MKNLIYLLLLAMSINVSFAQYKVNWSEAPKNPIPLRYTLNHYNLKGDVNKYKTGSFLYKFNRDGKLYFDESSYLGNRDLSYDEQGNLKHLKSSMKYEFDIELNNEGVITKKIFSSGTVVTFTYDDNGNYIEKYSNSILKQKNIYDNKNRIKRIEKYKNKSKELASYEDFEYEKYMDFTIVKRNAYYYSTDKAYNTTSFYDKNGRYVKSPQIEIVYDHKNNVIYKKDSKGKFGVKFYHYYDGTGNFDDVKPQSPTSTAKVQSPTSVAKVQSPTSTKAKSNNSCVFGDCQNGWGKKNYKGGYYFGFFKNGVRHGYGMYKTDDLGKYIGEWNNGNMSGYGYYETEDKKNFRRGYFKNNKLNGLALVKKGDDYQQGIYKNNKLVKKYSYQKNGDQKTGCINGNCKDGYGYFKWANGDYYLGFFKNTHLHMGSYYFSNGNTYRGEFNSANQFDGMGRYFFSNGDYYGGYFSKGQYQGLGYYYHKDTKKTEKGKWQNGQLISSL